MYLDSRVQEEEQKEIGWRETFMYPNLKPLIICLILAVVHQTTGISSIFFFSNEIFSKGYTGTSAEFVAKVGTFGTGCTGLLGAITAMAVAKYYGRKTMFLFGLLTMAIILLLLNIAALAKNQTGIVAGTILFVWAFNTSFGSFYFPYMSEVLGMKAISIASIFNTIATLAFGSFSNMFFNLLSPSNVYLILFFIQILSFTFVRFYVIETRGNTRQELARLYHKKEEEISSQEMSLIT